MKIKVNDMEGECHEIEGIEGWRVMEIIRDHGLPIRADCGGACCCATCHVYVEGNWGDKLVAPSDDERDLLDDQGIGLKDNSRLSCQILMSEDLDGLEVSLAPGSEKD